MAAPRDVEAISAIESLPAYRGQVGRWSPEDHLREMSSDNTCYFVLCSFDEQVMGFAIVQGFDDSDRKLHLKRIAVRRAGEGSGSVLLALLLDRLYRTTNVNRIDLDVFEDNLRAKRAYEKAGFRTEGLLRDYHRREDGAFVSMWLMSILRQDWEARGQLRR